MRRDEIQAFFGRHQEDWRARNPEALARAYTKDGTIVSPIFRTVVGGPAILDSYRSLFTIFPDWTFEAEQLLIDGDRVAQPYRAHATHKGEFMGIPGSGRKFEIQGVRLFAIRDRLIAHERRYYDFTGLLIQLGVLRSKPVG